MNKRIKSMLMVFVMVISMLATAVPASAAGTSSFKMTADKTTASPGETITYTIKMGPVNRLDSMKFTLKIPAGLTFVAGSGKLADNLATTLKCVDTAWTESTKIYYATLCDEGTGYSSATDTELMTFQCTVDNSAAGDLKIDFIIDPEDCYDPDYDNITFSTSCDTVTVTADPEPTPVTAANFTLDSGYEVGKKIVDIKVSGTNTGLETIGDTSTGYGSGYVIYTDDGVLSEDYDSIVTSSSEQKFEASKNYYLLVLLSAQDGYSLTGLTKENVKLGDKTAEKLIDNSGVSAAAFKLDPLTAPTHTHTKGTWVNEVPATCTDTGTKGYYPCTGCTAKLDAAGNEIADLTIEKNPDNHATGCTLGGWQKNDSKHWKEYSLCKKHVDEAEHNFADDATTCSAGCGATRKLAQTITANDVTFTYHETPAKIVVNGAMTDITYEVIEGADVVDAIAADGTPNYHKAGTAKVKITAAASDTYYAAETTVTVTINPKALTIVSAVAKPRDYQQGVKTVDMLTVQFYGESIDAAQIGATGVMDTDSAGTDKVVHVTVTLKGDAANNYTLPNNTFDTKVTINKIDPTAPTNLTGKTGNELSSVTLPEGWTWVEPETVMTEGTQTYKANYAGTVNYNAKSDVDLTVVVSDKTAQTITADNVTATYGETKSITASTTGDGALSYAVKTGADVVTVDADGKLTFQKAGTATVTVTAAETATYAKAIKDVTITVKKAAVTVTAKNQSIYVNGTAPDLTAADAYTVSGLVNGDTLTSISLVYAGTPDVTKAGSYDIVVTATVDESKYDLTTVNGKLTISNRPSSGGGGGGVSTYTITVDSSKNGTVTSSHKSAAKGTTVTITVKPDKGFELDALTVTDGSGKKVSVTEKSGKYTFTMPASKVTVKATFAEIVAEPENPFVDVADDAYYFDAVLWAAEEGITGGTSATTFSPNATCTRAQAVTFLWRAAGSPAPKSSVNPFTDVAEGSYYYDAVLWAVEQGITKGTSDTTFSPNATCTRAQIVTFLWRSQKSPASDSVNPFTDVAADAYYNTAVLWAAENGITGGTSATTFSPNANCTRAQIVTFLYRCLG